MNKPFCLRISLRPVRNFIGFSCLLIVSAILSISHNSGAQTWNNVGTPGFTATAPRTPSISVDPSGAPFIAFCDSTHGYAATVMKFNGTAWVTVGTPGFSAGEAQYTSIVFDRSGIPIVAYTDWADSGRVTVMKFNGTSWVVVGSRGFSPGYNSTYVSLALDTAGTPFVVWGGGLTSVMKYSGSGWVMVGSSGFSAGNAQYCKIALDRSGTPYVIYEDAGNALRATVMKFNGASWVNVGAPGFSSTSQTQYTDIAIDSSGVPYAAFSDGYHGPARVMKFDGSAWVPVGGAATPSSEWTSIVLDASGTPFVGCMDISNGRKATVMKFNGSSWVTVGTAGFSSANTYNNALASDARGALYAAFTDGSFAGRGTVMNFAPTTTASNTLTTETRALSVFPNPGKSLFTLSISAPGNEDASIVITNAHGKKVRELMTKTNSMTQIQLNEAPGIYFVTATTDQYVQNLKIVIW